MGNLEVEVLPYSSEKLSYVGILIPQGSKLSEPGGGTQIHDFGPCLAHLMVISARNPQLRDGIPALRNKGLLDSTSCA